MEEWATVFHLAAAKELHGFESSEVKKQMFASAPDHCLLPDCYGSLHSLCSATSHLSCFSQTQCTRISPFIILIIVP